MLSKIGKWYSEVFLYKGSQGLTVIARIAVLVMMMVNLTMVIVRKLFVAAGWKLGGGIVGGYEVTQMSMIVLTACACAYTWYTAGHIRIGLFRDNMKERRRAILDAVFAFAGTVYVGILVWGLFLQAGSYVARRVVTPLMEIPILPFAFIFTIVMAHVFLVLLRSFIGLASKAMGKKCAVEPYLKEQ